MRLAGKRVAISGAGAGIGRAGALLFAREGAQVLVVDRDAAALAALAADAGALPVHCHRADLSQPASGAAMVARAVQVLGGLDVLWSHAGMNGPGWSEGLDRSAYDGLIALNLTAAVEACGAALARMTPGASVVLTASLAGVVGSVQSPLYAATKHALVGLAKSLALQAAPRGIRVNALCPGPVRTRMMEDLRAGRLHPDGAAMIERLIATVPMGRLAEPEEIAEAALWLASDASSYVTGQALVIDGGVTAR